MVEEKGFQSSPPRASIYTPKPFRPAVAALILTFFALLPAPAIGADKELKQEEAQFDVYVAGKEIGQEKFSIQTSPDSVSSNSIMNFSDPGNQHQKVKIETQLNMDGQYVPQTYLFKTDIGGRQGVMKGTFVPGQANFEYQTGGNPRKSGLLVGDRYIVLDTNVFHHFVFIGRLFDFTAAKTQSLEVVIPQEMSNGVLKINEVGKDEISVRGKKRDLHHLRADSGALLIDLWVDDQRILYKIAVPSKQIEVIRNR